MAFPPQRYPVRRAENYTPAIDTLAADAVVFDRAYRALSAVLPSHSSSCPASCRWSRRSQRPDSRWTGVCRRSRRCSEAGIQHRRAVSSFLLRPSPGARRLHIFDSELPESPSDVSPSLVAMARRRSRRRALGADPGRPPLLPVRPVDQHDADAAVTRLSTSQGAPLLCDATIVLVGDRVTRVRPHV